MQTTGWITCATERRERTSSTAFCMERTPTPRKHIANVDMRSRPRTRTYGQETAPESAGNAGRSAQAGKPTSRYRSRAGRGRQSRECCQRTAYADTLTLPTTPTFRRASRTLANAAHVGETRSGTDVQLNGKRRDLRFYSKPHGLDHSRGIRRITPAPGSASVTDTGSGVGGVYGGILCMK